MLATGVDIIEIERVAQASRRWGSRFLERIYTPDELAYCGGKAQRLATRFAAKEAVMKVLGTGIRGVGWKEIEVVRRRGQPPTIRLHGRAFARAQTLGMTELAVSLSHSRTHAIAFIVGMVK